MMVCGDRASYRWHWLRHYYGPWDEPKDYVMHDRHGLGDKECLGQQRRCRACNHSEFRWLR